VQTINVSTKKLSAKLSYEKATCKMLVKLTPGEGKELRTGSNSRGKKRNRLFT
jgi:hypothetical protein